jgi:tripartite ATP-independent transporter DctM subunit
MDTSADKADLRVAPARADELVNVVLSAVSAVWIFAIMALVCADIFMRNLLNAPISGVAELIALSVPACVFLQLPAAVAQRRLIRAELLIGALERRRPRAAAAFKLLFALVGVFLFWKLLLWGWPELLKSYAGGEFSGVQSVYQIPVWPFKLTLIVGAAFGLLQFARQAVSEALTLAGPRFAGSKPAVAEGLGASVLIVALLIAVVVAFVAFLALANPRPIMVGICSLAAMLALTLVGMPIPLALMSASYLGIWVIRSDETLAVNTLGLAASTGVASYEFGVIPLFIMMGLVLEKADVGRDAFQVAASLLRSLRGGLGIATVGANAIFAAIVGSSIASAAVFSRIAVPPMVAHGYTKRFSVGTVAGSSVLGMLIPPSLLLIVYGLVAEASVGRLFIAAVIPGIILALAFSLTIYAMTYLTPRIVGDVRPAADVEAVSPGQIASKLLPIVALVATVIGGIYGGLFTPTEAAAVGTALAFLIAALKRRIGWAECKSIVLETSFVSAAVLFIIVAANLYTRQVALSGIPMQVSDWVTAAGLDMTWFLAVYLVLLLLFGMILDSVSIMLIMLPIMLPVLDALDGDKIWFGIVTTIAVEIGLLTPPFGLSVYVVKGVLPRDFVTLADVFIGSIPFVLVMIVVTLLVMAIPELSLWLLRP